MTYFHSIYKPKEIKYKRNYEIDELLYSELEQLTTELDATVNDMVNDSIEKLIKDEDVILYKKDDSELSIIRSIYIKDSNLKGLEILKEKYGVSLYKLVNIAIRNALHIMTETKK